MSLLQIIEKVGVPNVILRHIIMKYLDFDSINHLLSTVNLTHVLDDYSKNLLRQASMGFTRCVVNGYLDAAKWLYSPINNNTTPKIESKDNTNRRQQSEWLNPPKKYNILGKKIIVINDKLRKYACLSGNLPMVKWIYSFGFKIDADLVNFVCIDGISCEGRGYFRPYYTYKRIEPVSDTDKQHVIEWLLSECEQKGIIIDRSKIFMNICARNHLSAAKWLYLHDKSYDDSDITNKNLIMAFVNACQQGFYEMAQWLYSLVKINVDNYNYNFRVGYGYHPIQTIKWLHSIGYTKLNYELLFKQSCKCADLELAKWIYSFNNITDNKIFNDLFRKICTYDNSHYYLDMVKWLYSLGSIDIHANNDEAFRMAINNNRPECAKWLYSLGGIDINDLMEKYPDLKKQLEEFKFDN